MTELPAPPPPSLRLVVDRDALKANWRALDTLSGTALAGAAIKADCYGLGLATCLPALRDAGCVQFFVAHWSEAAAAMAHVPAHQIAVLHGPLTAQDAAFAKATGVVPVINSLQQAQVWAAAGGGPKSGKCHLMVDTGINRIGISPADASDPAIAALDIDLLMSHLASADEDSSMNARQLAALRQVAAIIPHQRVSLANSAGIALGPDYACDLTRPGLALYGGVPRGELGDVIRPVARIEAAILQTRRIESGESVGYNATFTAPAAMTVAAVSLGYADGFLRCRGPGNVLRRGDALLPILGKVSMDMIVIDLAQAPDLAAGDWLEVPFDLPDAARQSTLSQYELLTTIGPRLRCAG
ncbi:MAG: alanine racemase [Erythrobacter sp.]